MKVINKNEGKKISYEVDGTSITFGDDELSLNCAKYQRDWGVNLNICSNSDGNLVIGTASGMSYVAEIEIPAKQYKYPEPKEYNGETMSDSRENEPPIPIPLNMDDVTLALWSIE